MKGSVKLMGKRRFTPGYKEEIIKLFTERKKKISEVARDIGVTSTSIRRWIPQYSEYRKDAFPGKGNLKKDIIYSRRFKTREEAKLAIIEYIETFYNCHRLHSPLGNISPMEYEHQYYSQEEVA